MIKYAEIEGYQNSGEAGMFSHLYRFFEKDKENPVMIFLYAYDVIPAMAFKGLVDSEKKSYSNIDLTEKEKATLEEYVGQIEQVDFIEIAKYHDSLSFARKYVEVTP